MEKGFIGALFFATIVAIFALKNGDKVLIDFIFAKVEVSQAIVIFVSSILGAVIVAILGVVKNLKIKKELRELNKRIAIIEEEKEKLQLSMQEQGEKIDRED
ncbi:MAG: LapA family protein [Tissierellia bacterium]|nr:LapA family protein [Tissierellia bacterium]